MPDAPVKYRVKFTLDDGREIYAKKADGTIDERTEDELWFLDHMPVVNHVAYSEDLTQINNDYRFFERNGILYSIVVRFTKESVT